MTALLYFDINEARPISPFAMRRPSDIDGEELISFPACPLTGTVCGDQVRMPFPHNAGIRETLINWLLYWGIPFQVLP
ncbi:hypothetical protein ACVCII_24070 [Burkholderia glumae]|uniref:hypothetical protein n=1 Tax=Burkholderia glumae TaxID=337 RepID=UPI0020375105|nr:hypothetical protein [Burkholderia glumae]MCM2543896.1 hypothetical protein [Burkholderia glumae]